MSNLVNLDLSRLRNADVASLLGRLFEDFSKASLSAETDAEFKVLFDSIQQQLSVYNAGLDQVRASEDSSKISKVDAVRDNDLKALKDSLKPFRNSAVQKEKEAYEALMLLLSEYKGVEKDNYETQTTRLAILLERLQGDTYKKAVKELAIERFITRLESSNTEFKQIFAKRSLETLQKTTYDVKALRKVLIEDYRKLTNYVASLAAVKQDTFYKEVLSVINNGRKYFADTILSRRSVKKEAPKEAE